jgi:hypothetical protein
MCVGVVRDVWEICLHFSCERGSGCHCSVCFSPDNCFITVKLLLLLPLLLLLLLRAITSSKAHQTTLGVDDPCADLQQIGASSQVRTHAPAMQRLQLSNYVEHRRCSRGYRRQRRQRHTTACGLPQHSGRMQSTGIKVTIRRCLRHVRVRCISVSAHQLRHCAAQPPNSKP